MILPRTTQTTAEVGRHYDELHRYYLGLWGEHVHHGLWLHGDETPEQATRQLVAVLADRLALQPGERVCDIGCGYGATARLLAEERAIDVVGMTISQEQFRYASSALPATPQGTCEFLLQDWLENTFQAETFDAVYAIESSEHMPDKPRCFAEMFRVLKPGGRAAVYAWLARERPSAWQVDWLLAPICTEGRLPGMGTETEYRQWFAAAGFREIVYTDFSRQVRKTWRLCAGRLARLFLADADARHFALRGPENRVFAKTVFRIWCAYRLGTMRYGLFTAEKGASTP
ncbi:MAG: class I SAM-dependent methyltransferase [Candidatus Hydrogenedentes bacterium]|nr:class I SAM-dependent methyltransferase [Candidatus Hydrogenedentota bacterium]